MNSQDRNLCKKHFSQFCIILGFLFIFVIAGCVSAPKLTPEDRRSDIEFLARWAKDYSPFVELNETHKGLPDYETLKPTYIQNAEQAGNNEELFHVLYGYIDLIGASGHAYLPSEKTLLLNMFDSMLKGGRNVSGIRWYQFNEASYWARLSQETFAHPPFPVVRREGDYFTGTDWRTRGVRIPRNSKILRVNGMPCHPYLEYLKRETRLRYVADGRDWITEQLLVISESKDFEGWEVDFLLPDGSTGHAFVPLHKGLPDSKQRKFTDWKRGNCICLELGREVGYIRIKSMLGNFEKGDGKKIRRFLDDSQGKYSKLIIDIRSNPGGSPYYFYNNLMRPFLDEPVVYKQTTGIRRKFSADTEPRFLESLRGGVSTWAWEVSVEETMAPDGFDGKDWIFYEITRKVEPSERYNFSGRLYVMVDGRVGSAADDYANTVKRSHFAKLVGRDTAGGAAAYVAPIMVRLPRSGMIVVLEADLVINPDGSFDELFGTRPDIELAPCDLPEKVTKEELLQDEWVRKIIEGSIEGKIMGG